MDIGRLKATQAGEYMVRLENVAGQNDFPPFTIFNLSYKFRKCAIDGVQLTLECDWFQYLLSLMAIRQEMNVSVFTLFIIATILVSVQT